MQIQGSTGSLVLSPQAARNSPRRLMKNITSGGSDCSAAWAPGGLVDLTVELNAEVGWQRVLMSPYGFRYFPRILPNILPMVLGLYVNIGYSLYTKQTAYCIKSHMNDYKCVRTCQDHSFTHQFHVASPEVGAPSFPDIGRECCGNTTAFGGSWFTSLRPSDASGEYTFLYKKQGEDDEQPWQPWSMIDPQSFWGTLSCLYYYASDAQLADPAGNEQKTLHHRGNHIRWTGPVGFPTLRPCLTQWRIYMNIWYIMRYCLHICLHSITCMYIYIYIHTHRFNKEHHDKWWCLFHPIWRQKNPGYDGSMAMGLPSARGVPRISWWHFGAASMLRFAPVFWDALLPEANELGKCWDSCLYFM